MLRANERAKVKRSLLNISPVRYRFITFPTVRICLRIRVLGRKHVTATYDVGECTNSHCSGDRTTMTLRIIVPDRPVIGVSGVRGGALTITGYRVHFHLAYVSLRPRSPEAALSLFPRQLLPRCTRPNKYIDNIPWISRASPVNFYQ